MANNILSVSEWFYSIQGEGPNAGLPSVFLRLTGCNLTCKAWPCDTTEVWKKGIKYTVEQIYDHYKQQGWLEAFSKDAIQTFSGGETLLWQNQLVILRDYFSKHGYNPYTEVETNGTIQPTVEFSHWIDHWNVSPKLESAGDPLNKRYKPEVLKWMTERESVMFKFVVNVCNKNTIDKDLEEIDKIRKECSVPHSIISLMPEGGTKEENLKNSLIVVEVCKKLGYRFSPRLHLYIWNKAVGV